MTIISFIRTLVNIFFCFLLTNAHSRLIINFRKEGIVTNTRLKILRKTLNLTQQEFADRLGIKRNTIANYETGRNEPIDSVFSLICREFNVNEEWLKNGIEPMFLKTPSSTMEQLRKEFHLDDFSYHLIYEYLKLDDKKRRLFREFFYNILDGINYQELSDPSKSEETVASEEAITIEEAEEAYKKSRLLAVKKMDLSASNTSADTTTLKKDSKKVSNQ